MSSVVDWSSLPPELLQATATNLPTIIDYIHFRAVCRSWYAAAQMKCRFLPREFPCIMVPTKHSSTRRQLLFNPVTTKSFHSAAPSEFSEIQRFFGSSFGRLIIADGSPDGVIVFNPLTGEKDHLPSLLSFPGVRNFDSSRSGEEYMIQRPDGVFVWISSLRTPAFLFHKVVLTHDCEDNHPNKPFAFVLSYLDFNLVYCKHGDRSWRTIAGTGKYDRDAVYMKGKLYLSSFHGSLAICDFNNDPPAVEFITVEEGSDSRGIVQYLVDAMGELLWVQKYVDFSRGWQTLKFAVFKFDQSIKKWKSIKSSGNKVLFVGKNSSVALAASDYPGCKENAIYFTDDWSWDELYNHCSEVSMYDMSSESVEVIASYPKDDLPGLMWGLASGPWFYKKLCWIEDVDMAKSLVLEMIDSGPPPGNEVFNCLINGLTKAGDMEEALNMMELMKGRGLKPDVYTYSVIISGYARAGEMEEACKIFDEAKSQHSKLSPVTFHSLIRGFCKLEQFDKAVNLLGEMKLHGVEPNHDEYNKLIKSLCFKALDWETAEKLREDMEANGVILNGRTRALISAVKELKEGVGSEILSPVQITA